MENGYLDMKCKGQLKYQDEEKLVQGLYKRHAYEGKIYEKVNYGRPMSTSEETTLF